MDADEDKKLTFWGVSSIVFIITILYAIPVITVIPSKILVAAAIIRLRSAFANFLRLAYVYLME